MTRNDRLEASRLRSLLDSFIDVVICVDADGRICDANPAVEVLLGWRPEDLVGQDVAVLAGGEHRERHGDYLRRYLTTGERRIIGRSRRVHAQHRSGLQIPVSLSVTEVQVDGQRLFTGVLRDVRLELEHERELARQRDELKVQMEVTRILQLGLPPRELVDRVLRAIIALAELEVEAKAGFFLVEGRELVLRQTVGEFSEEFLEREARIPFGSCLCGRAAEGGEVLVSEDCFSDPRHEHRFDGMKAHGHYIVPVKVQGRVVGVIFLYTDPAPSWDQRRLALFETLGTQIGMALQRAWVEAELAASRVQLEELALNDALTGLLNRRAVLQRAASERARVARDGGDVAVLMLDLDHFKRVNDSYGHLAGDAVLREASARLRKAVRPYDLVGRYGGEEFVVFVVGSGMDQALLIAERIRASMAASPVPWQDHEIALTVSIGVAAVAREEELLDAMGCADTALYAAKRAGRNRVVVASSS